MLLSLLDWVNTWALILVILTTHEPQRKTLGQTQILSSPLPKNKNPGRRSYDKSNYPHHSPITQFPWPSRYPIPSRLLADALVQEGDGLPQKLLRHVLGCRDFANGFRLPVRTHQIRARTQKVHTALHTSCASFRPGSFFTNSLLLETFWLLLGNGGGCI